MSMVVAQGNLDRLDEAVTGPEVQIPVVRIALLVCMGLIEARASLISWVNNVDDCWRVRDDGVQDSAMNVDMPIDSPRKSD